jgi:hypothetical protein
MHPFPFQNQKFKSESMFRCAIETDDRMSGGGPQWCNLVEGRGCGR